LSKAEEIFGVEGMSCGHCEASIKKALGVIAGVDKVSIELSSKLVTVAYDDALVQSGALKEAIEEQGFEVK
jgi:copper chaperone